jgi:E3 SUMO-protein ligase PIAS1
VRVNNAQLAANLKGVKKKPGTAPPADLTSLVRKAPGVMNALEIIYINSQPNTPPKVVRMLSAF